MRKRYLVYLTAALLAGCSADRLPFVYRMDIQQGNVITQDMVNQLEPGMSRRQVEFLLGTPVFDSTFHPDRWDYVYTFKPGGDDMVQRRVTLYFSNDQLERIQGDFAPQPPEQS